MESKILRLATKNSEEKTITKGQTFLLEREFSIKNNIFIKVYIPPFWKMGFEKPSHTLSKNDVHNQYSILKPNTLGEERTIIEKVKKLLVFH